MSWPNVFASRLRGLFVRKRLEHELENEVRFHLEMQAEDNIRAGMKAAEARDAARRSFGGLESMKETYREARTLHVLETTMQDARYALRTIRRSPVFAAAAIFTLALGIGANTAIFQVLDAVVLRSLPVRDPPGLVLLQGIHQGKSAGFSYPLFREMSARQHAVAGIFAAYDFPVDTALLRDSETLEGVRAQLATGGYFRLLGIDARIGRTFNEGDDTQAAPPVAVVSYQFWQRAFAGRADAVGQTLRINKAAVTVIGVTPPDFFGERVGSAPDVWLPISLAPRVESSNWLDQPGWGLLSPMARLRQDVSPGQAQAELNVLYTQLGDIMFNLDKTKEIRLELKPGGRGLREVSEKYGRTLWLLMGIVGFVVLIACCNLATLLLARSEARAHEIGVRLALGAARMRLVRQLLTESLVLAVMGGLLGIVLATWGSGRLIVLVFAEQKGRITLGLDWRVFCFTAMLCVVATCLFGLAPALLATKRDLQPALRANPRTQGGGQSAQTLAKAFVVAQVAVSLLLVAGASVLVRSFWNLTHQNFGYRQEGVLLIRLPFDIGNFKQTKNAAFCDALERRMGELPGVRGVSLAGWGLLGNMQKEGKLALSNRVPQSSDEARFFSVSANYFETMGILMVAGRAITDRDLAGKQNVAVISETASRRLFRGENPVGRFFTDGDRFDAQHAIQIVGVAHDVRFSDPREPFGVVVFESLRQFPAPLGAVVIRTVGDPRLFTRPARDALRQAAPNLKIMDAIPLSDVLDSKMGEERMLALLSGAFGVLALLLASVGLYGVVAYGVERRTKEIGVRLALGAKRRQVTELFVREIASLLAVGMAIGGAATIALGKSMDALVFGLTPRDPAMLSIAGALLTAVALIAVYLGTRRVTRLNPLDALRHG